MLVDLPPLQFDPSQFTMPVPEYVRLLEELGEWPLTRRSQGVYETGINPEMVLESAGIATVDRWAPLLALSPAAYEQTLDAPDFVPMCGVADTPEQILEHYPQLVSDLRRFVVCCTEMRKANQPPEYGWRWAKWGDYIGTKHPQHEYLHDEGPDIEAVWVFEILELTS